jgi:3-oxoacyl-[acyl-carrier protein] reductase
MSHDRLKAKVALVTGAGRGIGAAIAQRFAREGARVAVVTRTEASGRECVEQIQNAGGEAWLQTADLVDVDASSKVVAQCVAHYGGIDILVHNAASMVSGPVEEFSENALEEVLSVNLKSCFRLSSACLPHFRERGGGRLLFTSSVTGPRVAMPEMSYYAASKSGVNGFIRNAALELASLQITVNGVEPGFIRTPALEVLGEKVLHRVASHIPIGRIGDPDDVAQAMLFLATDEARYITGQTIVVDGGSTLPESPVFSTVRNSE